MGVVSVDELFFSSLVCDVLLLDLRLVSPLLETFWEKDLTVTDPASCELRDVLAVLLDA